MNITPEMAEAWSTLQKYSATVRQFLAPTMMERAVCWAIDTLDNSDFMVPVEEAGCEDRQTDHDCDALGHPRCSDYTAPLEPAEWGDTTREDMARHQQNT